MIVCLRLFGMLQRLCGAERAQIELPPEATLAELLEAIDARWGAALPAKLWDRQRRRFIGPVVLLSGGSDLHDPATRLVDGQEISLVVPLAGG
ncbi:MAG: MoaD/ThiS family protein [Anaerolineae bacterium]